MRAQTTSSAEYPSRQLCVCRAESIVALVCFAFGMFLLRPHLSSSSVLLKAGNSPLKWENVSSPLLPTWHDVCNDKIGPRCKVLLASFPNTGTTWTLALFKAATGNYGEAVYKEGTPTPWGSFISGPLRAGFSLPACHQCRLIKSHAPWSPTVDVEYMKVIVLHRNYRDTLLANLRYASRNLKEDQEMCLHPSTNGSFNSLLPFARQKIEAWHCSWTSSSLPILHIAYEDLILDPEAQLNVILHFLGYGVSIEERNAALRSFPPKLTSVDRIRGNVTNFMPNKHPGDDKDGIQCHGDMTRIRNSPVTCSQFCNCTCGQFAVNLNHVPICTSA